MTKVAVMTDEELQSMFDRIMDLMERRIQLIKVDYDEKKIRSPRDLSKHLPRAHTWFYEKIKAGEFGHVDREGRCSASIEEVKKYLYERK